MKMCLFTFAGTVLIDQILDPLFSTDKGHGFAVG